LPTALWMLGWIEDGLCFASTGPELGDAFVGLGGGGGRAMASLTA
jgi:hypothetical protein